MNCCSPREIPRVGDRGLERAEGVISKERLRRNRRRIRWRLRCREGIRRAKAGIRIKEVDGWAAQRRVDVYIRNERRSIGVDVIKHTAHAAVEEISGAATQTGLARSEDIPCKTDTWHEVGINVRDAIGIETRITSELQAGRSERKEGGVSSGRIGCREEAAHAPLALMPREERFVTQAIANGEPPSQFPAVLTIDAVEVAAQVKELT